MLFELDIFGDIQTLIVADDNLDGSTLLPIHCKISLNEIALFTRSRRVNGPRFFVCRGSLKGS